MKIIKIFNSEISKEVFNEEEKEYNIPVKIDEQNSKECCWVCVNYQGSNKPTFLLLTDMKSEDLGYPFTNDEMFIYQNLVTEWELEQELTDSMWNDEG